MTELNLNNLQDINNQLFTQELKKAPMSLLSNQVKDFYSVLLSHFQNSQNIDQLNGNNILIIIYETLNSVEGRISTFVQRKFHLQLPYSDERFIEHIFNILHLLAEKAPYAFDDKYKMSQSFKLLINNNPAKSLVLFELLALKFGDIESPWNAFDLLFKSGKIFLSNFTTKYSNLLIYLSRNDPAFLRGRGQICFDRLSNHLSLLNHDNEHPITHQDDLVMVNTLYVCLCKLFDFFESLNDKNTALNIESNKVPVSLISYHISIPDLQPPIVSYLLRFSICVDEYQNDNVNDDIQQLLKTLIELTNSTDKAGYVLMNLAQNEIFARYLASNNFWLAKKLNPPQLTIILVMSIFQHTNLVNVISNSRYLFSFIKNVVNENENSERMIEALSEIFRKLDMNIQSVIKFESEGIIDVLLSKAEQNQENGRIVKFILSIFGEFAKFDFTKEDEEMIDFSPICSFLMSIIKNQGDNMDEAANLIAKYARIHQCLDIFRKRKVHQLLESMDSKRTSNAPTKSRKQKNPVDE